MPYVFRSYRETAQTGWNAQSPTCDVSVVDACRACLASLLWFDSVEISPFGYFCDADLLELNPALETSHEMRTGSIQCLLNIGARRSQRQETLERETFEHRFPYRRWTPTDPSSDHRSVSQVKQDALIFVESVKPELKDWAQKLVNFRRERAGTVEWSRYACLRFRCPFCEQSFLQADLCRHIENVLK